MNILNILRHRTENQLARILGHTRKIVLIKSLFIDPTSRAMYNVLNTWGEGLKLCYKIRRNYREIFKKGSKGMGQYRREITFRNLSRALSLPRLQLLLNFKHYMNRI